MSRVVLSAQILKVETKPDNTLLLKINTQEPTAQEAAAIIGMNMQQVNMVLITEEDYDESRSTNP